MPGSARALRSALVGLLTIGACAGPEPAGPPVEKPEPAREQSPPPKVPPPAPARASAPEAPEAPPEPPPPPPGKAEPPVRPARSGARVYASEAGRKDGKGLRRDSLRAGILKDTLALA